VDAQVTITSWKSMGGQGRQNAMTHVGRHTAETKVEVSSTTKQVEDSSPSAMQKSVSSPQSSSPITVVRSALKQGDIPLLSGSPHPPSSSAESKELRKSSLPPIRLENGTTSDGDSGSAQSSGHAHMQHIKAEHTLRSLQSSEHISAKPVQVP
jgi:hypothetical protein